MKPYPFHCLTQVLLAFYFDKWKQKSYWTFSVAHELSGNSLAIDNKLCFTFFFLALLNDLDCFCYYFFLFSHTQFIQMRARSNFSVYILKVRFSFSVAKMNTTPLADLKEISFNLVLANSLLVYHWRLNWSVLVV